jgi:branched-chain amino acid transport system substrate-binding protein
MSKLITGIIVTMVVVVGFIAIFSNSDTQKGEIKIGVIQPLTGDAASYGESEARAIQIAVDEINAEGGIDDRMIKLITEDGKCDPQAGGSAAQKLVNIDKIKIIIGGACSGETLAAAKITESAQVILISPSATSPAVTDAGDFVFRVIPSDALAGKIAAKYAVNELEAKSAAVITELTDYAQGLREVFKSAFIEFGGEIVADETFNTGTSDFRTIATKIQAEKPDIIYVVPQTKTPGIAIFKQLRENEVDAWYMTAEVLMDVATVEENSEVLEGIYGIEGAIDWENNPRAKSLAEAHNKKFGEDPGAFSANAYDAVYLIKAAIESQGIDPILIRDWLYTVKNWPGALGPITMDENGDPIIGLHVRLIKDGEVTDIGAYTP